MTIAAAEAIFVICALLWWAIRHRPYVRSWKRRRQVDREGIGDIILQAVAIMGVAVIPLVYVFAHVPQAADTRFAPALAYIGTGMFALAIWINWCVHRALGANFSPSLVIFDRHRLITTGIYKYIRHPLYASLWLWAVAQALLLPNWVAGYSGLIGVGLLYGSRVGREEQMMLDAFGERYRAYMARTARLVPGVY